MIKFFLFLELLQQQKQMFIDLIKATGYEKEIFESDIEMHISDLAEDYLEDGYDIQVVLQYEGKEDAPDCYYYFICDLDFWCRKLIFNRFIFR